MDLMDQEVRPPGTGELSYCHETWHRPTVTPGEEYKGTLTLRERERERARERKREKERERERERRCACIVKQTKGGR